MKIGNYNDLLDVLRLTNDYIVKINQKKNKNNYHDTIIFVEHFCFGEIEEYPTLTLKRHKDDTSITSCELRKFIEKNLSEDDLKIWVALYNPDTDYWYYLYDIMVDDKKKTIFVNTRRCY